MKTFSRYDGSSSLIYVKNCVDMFEKTNKSKYFNDFKEFVFESSVEDFCDFSDAEVIVSTIHKSKGKEFDDVFMLISDSRHKRNEINDEIMRRYYVGMTRAKNRLFIHTDSSCFDSLPADNYKVDRKKYDIPEEIVLQLTLKDVFLDLFKNKKSEILKIKGGNQLYYKDFQLFNSDTGNPVVTLSIKNEGITGRLEQKRL